MNTRRIRELNKKIRDNINLLDKTIRSTSFVEKRTGSKDRRIFHTFLANDRRCGIADRRKREK